MTKNKWAQVISSLLFVASSHALGQASRDESNDPTELPEYVDITSSSNAGSGCRNSNAFAVTDGGQYLALITNSFAAQKGPNVPLADSRKNCSASIHLSYPSGWTFAVGKASLEGSTYLESGVEATVSTRVYTQGQANDSVFSNKVSGPRRAYLVFGGKVADQDLQFQPCNASRALNITLSLALTNLRNRYARGYVQLGNNNGQAALFGLVWKRCDY